MKQPLLIPGFLALIAAGTVNADVHSKSPYYSPAYTACMDKASSTADMVECIGTEHDAQDAKLNRVYKTLMTSLSADRKKALRGAQRAWMAYRDANCQFYFDPDGGTMAALEANLCVLNMTTQRAAELDLFGKRE